MKFAYVRGHRGVFDVHVMCAVLGVTAAGFYAWCKRPDSPRTTRARELAQRIRIVHHETNGVYGSLRITKELRHRHVKVNRKTVARLMKSLGIRSKVSKRFRVHTTDSNHPNPVAPNTLDQNFAGAAAPNQVWGADITFIHTDEGFLYLAGVMDLYSRKIVGWSMDDSMTTGPVESAFNAALLHRKNSFRTDTLGLLHHSDRGTQYTSARYRELLARHGVEPSMSRTGNVTTTPWWNRSGAKSRPRWSTTSDSSPKPTPARRCSSTSKCSTIAGDCTPHWATSAPKRSRLRALDEIQSTETGSGQIMDSCDWRVKTPRALGRGVLVMMLWGAGIVPELALGVRMDYARRRRVVVRVARARRAAAAGAGTVWAWMSMELGGTLKPRVSVGV